MATCGIKLLLVLVIISVCSVYSNPNIYGVGLPLSYVYYTKSDWGGVQSTDVRPLKTPVPYVVIHHTYIPGACSTPVECKADMRSMQNYHISMGWGDIGYNFCIGSDGGVYEGRGWDNIGIHAGPANNYSIGICLIGDWRVEEPPEAMLESTKALIETGVLNGKVSSTYKLVGHKQVMATECPGNALFNIISEWPHFSNKFTRIKN
ncbi:unnamed protein product [Danaus chrysippus]|uniref:Peptidoglycan-recognition protein n=1 Tax=Danaus chrysippus TaxID=151541 RepID=A0A8J2QBZ6_9NEOP|nr:unnamed protein product [Danaus chrysippus]